MGGVPSNDDDSLLSFDLDVIYDFISRWSNEVKRVCQHHYRTNPTFYNLVFTIYAATFFAILPILCYNMPYSAYWSKWESKDMFKQATSLNHERFITENNYIRGLKLVKPYTQADITIGVITVKRSMGNRALGYLTQVMAKLDRITSKANPFSLIQLLICDAHAGPGPHTEADTLQQYFIRKQRFPQNDPSAVIMDR